MSIEILISVIIVSVVVFGLAVAYLVIRRQMSEQKLRIAEETAKRILEDAKREAETKRKEALLEAKEEAVRMRRDFEQETKERKAELSTLEKRLLQREDHLEKKGQALESSEKKLKEKTDELERIREELEKSRDLQIKELEKVSGLPKEEAKKILLDSIEKEVEREAALIIKRKEEEIKKEAEKKAREILATAIQRCAVDHVVETTTTVVDSRSSLRFGQLTFLVSVRTSTKKVRIFSIAAMCDSAARARRPGA